MSTAGDVLNVMRSLIGTKETPDGSNNAPPVTSWYGMKAAWCAMTVSYALWKAGHPGIKFAWTPTGRASFQSGAWGTWHTSGPKPGDLIFFSFGGVRTDHVGIVEAVNGDGTVTTIEGNIGNACKRARRPARAGSGGVQGFGRPRYDGQASPSVGQPTSTGGRRTLAVGSRGEDVRGLQRVLIGAGHLPANGADGIFGPATKAALVKLQRQLKVEADGIAGPRTLEAIDALLRYLVGRTAPPPLTGPVLKAGARGDAVRRLQARLEGKGFELGAVDGIFGARTTAAVKAFQRSRRLTADGIVGPRTWAALT